MPFAEHEALYYDLFCAGSNYADEARELRRKYPAAKTVLEIGAGTGLLTRELRFLGFDVVAIEPSPAMRHRLLGLDSRHGPRLVHGETVQEHFLEESPQYDIVVAHCDVLNYVPHDEIDWVVERVREASKNPPSIKVWDPDRGIWPWRYRRKNGASQIRLALRWGNTAHVWFFFWGYGPLWQHHKLYLHKGL
jgi:SAM-dependent methyltransferase